MIINREQAQQWFNMDWERQSSLERASWITLRERKQKTNDKKQGELDYREECVAINSIMFPIKDKAKAFQLKWNDFNAGTGNRSLIEDDGTYYSAEKLDLGFNVTGGISPVLCQKFPGKLDDFWHLNQDIVIAFNLLREGNSWLAPDEGFDEVAKIDFNEEGYPTVLQIRTDYLKDYLCARGMGLYINSYRYMMFVGGEEHKNFINLHKEFEKEEDSYRWEGRIKGSEYGDNKVLEFWSELWKSDWVSPGNTSSYVGRDARSELPFTINVSGDTLPQNKLVANKLIKGYLVWLWFKPECILELLKGRDSYLEWPRSQIGVVGFGLDREVRFGIHKDGYLNVYAKDIGLLPYWQQKIWCAHNVKPEDGLAEALHQTQVEGRRLLSEHAPESLLANIHNQLNDNCAALHQSSFFSKNMKDVEKLKDIHRFRSISSEGLGELAVDVYENCIKFINHKSMTEKIKEKAPQVFKENKKYHKLEILKLFLVNNCSMDDNEADALVLPLSGICELRNHRSHRNDNDLSSYLSMANIRENVHPIHQGYDLLNSYVKVLEGIQNIFEEKLKERD